jgi:hypothetical protein
VKRALAIFVAVAFVIGFIAGFVNKVEASDSLRRGDSGPAVAEVQQILAGFGYTVVVDSTFGPQTEKAVRSWQRSNGLTVDGIVGPVTLESLRSARRIGNQIQVTPTVPPPPTGLNGLPFAPEGLSGCAEMAWYIDQWDLPDVFNALGYRESRCRNDESVHTFCCWGWFQHYISSHLSLYSAYRQRIIDECHVTRREDIDSDNPLDKQRQTCVTAVVYQISGLSPWR